MTARKTHWPEARVTPQASANGWGTARSVAKLYGLVANDGKMLFKNPKTLKLFNTPLVTGIDTLLKLNSTYGYGLSHHYDDEDQVSVKH